MNKISTISVVTPSFNQAQYLSTTMESVLTQQGGVQLDYIVVDGGSIDGSVRLIEHYESEIAANRYAGYSSCIRFRWVSERDNGQADAIAKGFKMATGEILCWLNSDDMLLPGAFQKIAEHFTADDECGCVYGRAMYTDENGASISEYPTQPFDIRDLPIRNFICQPATFFRRSVYEAAGGLDETLRFTMDYDLWIRMTKVTRFVFLPELLATYRLHTQSKTVAPGEAEANHAEVLSTTIRHFSWAPVSKVYGYCYVMAKNALPEPFCSNKLCCGVTASIHSIFKYLMLNSGINRKDLRVLNPQNFWRFISGWEDVTVTAGKTKDSLKGQAN